MVSGDTHQLVLIRMCSDTTVHRVKDFPDMRVHTRKRLLIFMTDATIKVSRVIHLTKVDKSCVGRIFFGRDHGKTRDFAVGKTVPISFAVAHHEPMMAEDDLFVASSNDWPGTGGVHERQPA